MSVKREDVALYIEDALFLDGFDRALIGYVQRLDMEVALYDYNECIRILMERDGMTSDEAAEFFDYNVTGSWVGEKTPAIAFLKEAL